MKTMTRSISMLVFGALAVGGVACDGEDGGVNRTDGVAQVLLTDAPFPYDQVDRVDVHIVAIAVATSWDTTGAAEWTTLAEPNRTVNLLELQDGVTTLLGETQTNTWTVAGVRLEIRTDLSSITLVDGSRAQVDWQGPDTQVLFAPVAQPLIHVVEGTNPDLIIDFDVGRSFVAVPGGFVFLPWIRAVNAMTTGTLRGMVYGATGPSGEIQPVGHASVTVYQRAGANQLLVATGAVDAEGRFAIHYVSGGGPYLIEATPPSGVTIAAGYVNGVYVTPGQETHADVTLGVGAPDAEGVALAISGPSQVAVGSSIYLWAFTFTASGDSLFGALVTWSNSHDAAARLEGSGHAVRLTGLAPGSTTVIAASDDLADTVVVTVGEAGAPVASVQVLPATQTRAVGDSVLVQAILRDAVGNVLSGRAIDWSFDEAVVQAIGGFTEYLALRAVAAGTTTVRASVEGKEGSATVIVN
jgi:hypothetical protein